MNLYWIHDKQRSRGLWIEVRWGGGERDGARRGVRNRLSATIIKRQNLKQSFCFPHTVIQVQTLYRKRIIIIIITFKPLTSFHETHVKSIVKSQMTYSDFCQAAPEKFPSFYFNPQRAKQNIKPTIRSEQLPLIKHFNYYITDSTSSYRWPYNPLCNYKKTKAKCT